MSNAATTTKHGYTVGSAIGLTDADAKTVAEILSRTLADEYVLYTKTRNYHWNVVGPHFSDLHKFFEEQYDQLAEMIDETAERIRMLGHYSIGTMTEMLKHTQLDEEPGTYPTAGQMVEKLLADHEAIIRRMRDDIDVTQDQCHDAGNADFLTGLMEKHEKMAWMLRSISE